MAVELGEEVSEGWEVRSEWILSPDVFDGVGEKFCVSDLAEILSLSAIGSDGKMSAVEVIVEFCSDMGELVDILVVDAVPFGEIRFLDFFPRFVVVGMAQFL